MLKVGKVPLISYLKQFENIQKYYRSIFILQKDEIFYISPILYSIFSYCFISFFFGKSYLQKVKTLFQKSMQSKKADIRAWENMRATRKGGHGQEALT